MHKNIEIIFHKRSDAYAGDEIKVKYRGEDVSVKVRFNHDADLSNGILNFQPKEDIDYSNGVYTGGVVCGNILPSKYGEELSTKLKDYINQMFQEQKEQWGYPCHQQ